MSPQSFGEFSRMLFWNISTISSIVEWLGAKSWSIKYSFSDIRLPWCNRLIAAYFILHSDNFYFVNVQGLTLFISRYVRYSFFMQSKNDLSINKISSITFAFGKTYDPVYNIIRSYIRKLVFFYEIKININSFVFFIYFHILHF